jgi:prophage maintenance system killer protein
MVTQLTKQQLAILDEVLPEGFDQGVSSMVECLRALSKGSETTGEPEPTLVELAAIIEKALAKKHAQKAPNEQK